MLQNRIIVSSARGYALLSVLLLVVLITLSTSLILMQSQAQVLRSQEASALVDGRQMRAALEKFKQINGRFPANLEDLLEDKRKEPVQRILSKIPVDHLTGSMVWEVLRDEQSGIYAVHSRSEREPFKKVDFLRGEEAFEAAKTYRDWVFTAKK